MLGKVEVFRVGVDGKQLIAKEENMIVDGMKHHMADIFGLPQAPSATTFPDYPHRDKRWFNAQAMTLGPPKEGFGMFNSSWYPSGTANLSADASSRFVQLPKAPNIDFRAPGRNAIRHYEDNRYYQQILDPELKTVGEENSPWTVQTDEGSQWNLTQDGLVLKNSKPLERVLLVQDITPKQRTRYTLKTINRNSTIDARISLLRIHPLDGSFNYYSFERGGWLPEGEGSFTTHKGSLALDKHKSNFRLPDFERDVLNDLKHYKYRIQLEFIGAGEHTLERIELLDEENYIVKNSNFDDRDSIFYNSNFSFVGGAPAHAGNSSEASQLGLVTINNWNRVSPIDRRTYPSQDLSTHGSVRVIASGDYFADVPPGNFVSLKASADENIMPGNVGGAAINQTAYLPDSCFDKKWTDHDNLNYAGLPLLSFWAYAPSASVSGNGLKVVVTDNDSGNSYNFTAADDGTEPMHDWTDTPTNNWIVSPTMHDGWQFFSRFINLPQDATGRRFTVSVNALPNKSDGFAEYYVRSLTFGQMPGWKYGYQNPSSTFSLVHQHTDSSSFSGLEKLFELSGDGGIFSDSEAASGDMSSVNTNPSKTTSTSQTGIYSLLYNCRSTTFASIWDSNYFNQPVHGLDPDKSYFLKTISRPEVAGATDRNGPAPRFEREDFGYETWENYEFAGDPGLINLNEWSSPRRRDAPSENPNYKSIHPNDRCVLIGSSVGENLLRNSDFTTSSPWQTKVGGDDRTYSKTDDSSPYPGKATGWEIDKSSSLIRHRPSKVNPSYAADSQELVQAGIWDDSKDHIVSYTLEDNTNGGHLWFNGQEMGDNDVYTGTQTSSFTHLIENDRANKDNTFHVKCDSNFNGKISDLYVKEYDWSIVYAAFRGLPGKSYSMKFDVFREVWNTGGLTNASIEIKMYTRSSANHGDVRHYDFETGGWTPWSSNQNFNEYRHKFIGATTNEETGRWIAEEINFTIPPEDVWLYSDGSVEVQIQVNGIARDLPSPAVKQLNITAATYIKNLSLKGARGVRDYQNRPYPALGWTPNGDAPSVSKRQIYDFPPDGTLRYGREPNEWLDNDDAVYKHGGLNLVEGPVNRWNEHVLGPITRMNDFGHHKTNLYNLGLTHNKTRPHIIDSYQLIDASLPLYDGDAEVLGADYITSEKNYSGDSYDWTNGWHVSYADASKSGRDINVSSSPSGASIEIRPNGGAYHFDHQASTSLEPRQAGWMNNKYHENDMFGAHETSTLTVEAWVNPQFDGSGAYEDWTHGAGIAYNTRSAAGNRAGWGLDMRGPSDNTHAGHYVRFRTLTSPSATGPNNGTPSSVTSCTTEGVVSALDNEWSHIAAIIDGPNERQWIYVNGAFGASAALYNYSGHSAAGLKIGYNDINAKYFNGDMSEVRIYDRALASSVILNNYNSGRGQFGSPDDTGLITGWHLNTSSDGNINQGELEQPTPVSFSAYSHGHQPLIPLSRKADWDGAIHSLNYMASGFVDDVADPILYYVAKQKDLSVKAERDIAIGFDYLTEDMSRLDLYVQVKNDDGRIWSWDPSSASWLPIQENYACKVTATSGETQTINNGGLTTEQLPQFFRHYPIKVPKKFGENALWRIGVSPKLANQLPHQPSRAYINNVRFYEVMPQELSVPIMPEFPNPMDKSVQSRGLASEPDREGHYLNLLAYSSILDMSNDELARHGAYLPPSGMSAPSGTPFSGIYFASSTFGNPMSTHTSANNMSGYQWGEMTKKNMISPLGYIMKNVLPPEEQCTFDSSCGFIASSTEFITSSNNQGFTVDLTLGSDLLSGMGNFENGLHPSSTTADVLGAAIGTGLDAHVAVSSGNYGRYGNSLCLSSDDGASNWAGYKFPFTAARHDKFLVTGWYKSVGGTDYDGGAGNAAIRFRFMEADKSDATTAANFALTENGEWQHLSGILNASAADIVSGDVAAYIHQTGTDVDGDRLVIDNLKIQKIKFNGTSATYDGEREVKYVLTIPYKDYKFLDHYYGGIGTVGLWGLDYEKTSNKLGDSSGIPYLRSKEFPSPLKNRTYPGRAPGSWDPESAYWQHEHEYRAGWALTASGSDSSPFKNQKISPARHQADFGYPYHIPMNSVTQNYWVRIDRDASCFHPDYVTTQHGTIGSQSTFQWLTGSRKGSPIDFASSIILSGGHIDGETASGHAVGNLQFVSTANSATESNGFLGVSAIMTRFKNTAAGHNHTYPFRFTQQTTSSVGGTTRGTDLFIGLVHKKHDVGSEGVRGDNGKFYVYTGGGACYAWRDQGSAEDPDDRGNYNHVNLNDGLWHTLYVIRPAFNAAMPPHDSTDENPFKPRVWIDGVERFMERGGVAGTITKNLLGTYASGLQGPAAVWDTTGLPLQYVKQMTAPEGASMNWSGMHDASGGDSFEPKMYWTMGNSFGPVSALGSRSDDPKKVVVHDIIGRAGACNLRLDGSTAGTEVGGTVASSYSYEYPYPQTGTDNGGVNTGSINSKTPVPVSGFKRGYQFVGGNVYLDYANEDGASRVPYINPWTGDQVGDGAWNNGPDWYPGKTNNNVSGSSHYHTSGLYTPGSWIMVTHVGSKFPTCTLTGRDDFGLTETLYVNGDKVGTRTKAGSTMMPINSSGANAFGASGDTSGELHYINKANRIYVVSSHGHHVPRNVMKDWAVWDKPLTDDDVKRLYSNGFGLEASSVSPSSLRLWFPLGSLAGSADFSSCGGGASHTVAINKAASVHTDSSGYGTWLAYDQALNLTEGEGLNRVSEIIRTDSPRHTETPLYNFADIDEHPEYRLLAKKAFSGGLKLPDNSDYDDYITIEWTVKF